MPNPSLDPLDLFALRSTLTEEERMVQDSVRRLVDERVLPVIRECFEEHRFPRELVAELAALGLLGSSLEGYGCAGLNARSRQTMEKIGQDFVAKSVANGVEREVAEKIFSYMEGYASYGFCEAHAAAFATTAFKTAYLVEHHPAEFFAAVLSQQPMGFYAPNTICVELRRRGVKILPPDVNKSSGEFTVEGGAVRVSLAQVKNLSREDLKKILEARREKPFKSFRDFCRRSGVKKDGLESLVLCGACDSLHPNRRQLYWAIQQELEERQAGFDPNLSFPFDAEPYPELADYGEEEKLFTEYSLLGITPRLHFMEYWRGKHGLSRVLSSRDIGCLPDGETVLIGGLVIRPHRPPTKSGRTVVFLSLEDEFGLVDVTVFEDVYQKYGSLLFGGKRPPLAVSGTLQRRGRGLSVTAWKLEELRSYFDCK